MVTIRSSSWIQVASAFSSVVFPLLEPPEISSHFPTAAAAFT
jgi:hypothetical protein